MNEKNITLENNTETNSICISSFVCLNKCYIQLFLRCYLKILHEKRHLNQHIGQSETAILSE